MAIFLSLADKSYYCKEQLLHLYQCSRIYCRVILCIFCTCVFVDSCHCQTQEKHTLYLLSLLPYPDIQPQYQPSWDEGPSLIIAQQLAIDHINNRNDVLSNYTLSLIASDSGCNLHAKAYLSVVKHIVHKSRKTIAGIVGPGCSTSAAAVSPLMWRNGIDLINIHGAGSLLLSDRQRYKNSFGTLDSTEVFVNASLSLIIDNEWSHIATLYDPSRLYYYTTLQEFHNRIGGIAKLDVSSAVYDTFLPLEEIKQRYIRIIFLFVGPDFLRKIFCLAYHMDMYFPLYQWIIISRTAEEITSTNFVYGGQKYSCDTDQISLASNKAIIVHYQLAAWNSSHLTDVGLSYNDFLEEYAERVAVFNVKNVQHINSSFWAAAFYDAVWALALGFNNSLEELQQNNLSLEMYAQANPNITRIIKKSLFNIKFNGMSGLINFRQSDGYTCRAVEFYQVNSKVSTLVASYSNERGIIQLPNTSAEYLESSFPDIFIMPVIPSAIAIVIFTVVIALLLTLTLNVLIIVHAKFKTVKAASPNLLHVAFAGCYIIIITELLLCMSAATIHNSKISCLPDYIWRGMVHIGLTLILSIVTTRTWRIYRIFIHFRNPGQMLSNKSLVFFVTALVMVDIVLTIVWVLDDPLKPSITSYIIEDPHPKIAKYGVCSQQHPLAWFGSLLCYNYLLMLVALWITLKCRHIRSKQFRTRSLSLLVYMVSLVTGVGFPLYIVLNISQNHTAEFITLAFVLVIVVYLTIFLLFLPPLIPIICKKYLRSCCMSMPSKLSIISS